MGLVLLLLLTGCPASKAPRSWQGSDHAKVARYTYAGLRIAQRTEPRPYAHVEVLFGRELDRAFGYALTEVLLATALQGGSDDLPGPEFAAALERAGALVDIQTRANHLAIRLRCLPDQLAPAFEALAGVLLRPRFPLELYTRLSVQSQAVSTASAEASLQAALHPDILPEQIAAPDHENALRFLRNEVLVKCRMAITTVGPIDAEQLGDRLFNTLDQLPDGDCIPEPLAQPAWGRIVTHLDLVDEHQHIAGAMPGPLAGHPDAFPLAAAMDILHTWMQQRLVLEQHLLTAAEARYLPGLPGQAGQVRIALDGPRALQAAELFLSELRTLKAVPMRASRLDSAKAWLAVDGGIGMETAAAIAEQMGAAVYADSWANFGNPEARVAALTPAHIQHVLSTYCTQIAWGYIGDTLRLDRKTLLRL